MSDPKTYDVAILGSGIGGSMLAAILARHGFDVLLLEKEAHPRFAVGEAMLPQSSMLMWMLGQRFDVPEILNLSRTDSITKHVTSSCGVKRIIGFLYHRDGCRQDPGESHLLVPPVTPITSESHLFRQDVDLYMLKAAIGYGATYRDHAEPVDVAINGRGVTLTMDTGDEHHARYLVDGSGYRSVLAQRFGLREEPSQLRTRSRTLFNHFEGIKSYDDLLEDWEDPKLSSRWNEGTVHHVFDGGWFWVIPFNNHKDGQNPLCSVGLTLDLRKHPRRPGVSAEDEFQEIVQRFPSVAAHFQGARPVRPWVSTDRLQYSSTACCGERWFLGPHAYGFVDALYSRGLISTLDVLRTFTPRLMKALEDDDFSPERFAFPARQQAALLRSNDQMVHCSYQAFGSYPLWNAWIRLWLLSTMFNDFRHFRVIVKSLEAGDTDMFDLLDQMPLHGEGQPGDNPVQDLIDAADGMLAQVEAGAMTAEAASETIFQMLSSAPLPPVHAWGDPDQHHLDFLPEKLVGLIRWGRTVAPPPFNSMFDFSPENYLQGEIAAAQAPAA
jgi:FADH2 O2-dependent halogenase